MKFDPPINKERRSRPDGFHSARTNRGHPRREARRERAIERQQREPQEGRDNE